MAGVAVWASAGKDIRTTLGEAQNFHDQAASGWEDEEDIEARRISSGKLASSSKAVLDLARIIKTTYGDAITDLQAFKDKTRFAAK